MRPGLAGRLSRFLVGCHPRRWRERYHEEMLEVLDQHHPTVRTVVSLGASAVSAQLDPACRTDRLSLARLRRAALISAAIVAPLALVLAPLGYQVWQDSYWHPAADEPLETAAFSWNLTNPAHADRLAVIDGPGDFIQAFTFSPRGNLLAAVTYHGTVLVYSLADPARPARTATVRGLLTRAVFPSGSPQPTETPLCATCDGLGNYAVAFAPDGHTLTVVVDRAEMSANSGRDTIFDWPVTGSGTLGAGTAAARDVADFQPVIAPGDRTVLGSPPGSHAWHAWPLP